jgi:hypothetical protein
MVMQIGKNETTVVYKKLQLFKKFRTDLRTEKNIVPGRKNAKSGPAIFRIQLKLIAENSAKNNYSADKVED